MGDDPNDDPGDPCAIREIPIAIQPKSFNADGTQYYPADRAFFEGLGTGGIFADNTDVNIPFLPQANLGYRAGLEPGSLLQHHGGQWQHLAAARGGARALPPAFRQRQRFALHEPGDVSWSTGNGRLSQPEIPFYQIGSDQGLLPPLSASRPALRPRCRVTDGC